MKFTLLTSILCLFSIFSAAQDQGMWLNADYLKKGMHLMGPKGALIAVADVKKIISAPTRVYNMEVEDHHNYFVAKDGVLVHNGPYEQSTTIEKFIGELKATFQHGTHITEGNIHRLAAFIHKYTLGPLTLRGDFTVGQTELPHLFPGVFHGVVGLVEAQRFILLSTGSQYTLQLPGGLTFGQRGQLDFGMVEAGLIANQTGIRPVHGAAGARMLALTFLKLPDGFLGGFVPDNTVIFFIGILNSDPEKSFFEFLGGALIHPGGSQSVWEGR